MKTIIDMIKLHRDSLKYARLMFEKATGHGDQIAISYWMGRVHAEEKIIDELWDIV